MANKRYILASDFDGTFCRGGVNRENVEAVERFRAKGHLFGIITGRDYTGGYLAFKKLNSFPFDFIVTNNGASACDSEGNIYFSQTVQGNIPYGETNAVTAYIKRCLELTSSPCGIALEKTRLDFHPDYPDGKKEDGRVYSPISVLGNLEKFVSSNAVCDTPERAAAVTRLLKEKFGEWLNPIQNGRYIDVTPVGVDKGTGLCRLVEILGIDKDGIWTAGDNYNDLPMLEGFHGCAMSNGVEELKMKAEFVCDSVADFIEIILEK